MKIAVQLFRIPGKNLSDKAQWAADHGVEGLEIAVPPDVTDSIGNLREQADLIAGRVPISGVCGNYKIDGGVGFDFVNPDIEKREASIVGSEAVLKFCGEVGAAGQIVPPMFGPPVMPDLSPYKTSRQLEDEVFAEALKRVAKTAVKYKTQFFVEPLNRYEQSYLNTQADGIRVIKKSGVKKGVSLLSDFFHMHIEELDTPAAFRAAGKHVGYIHLADNTRMEPGTGDIDFVAGLKALRDIKFTGYLSYECGITGKTMKQQSANLAKSLDFMRKCLKKAQK